MTKLSVRGRPVPRRDSTSNRRRGVLPGSGTVTLLALVSSLAVALVSGPPSAADPTAVKSLNITCKSPALGGKLPAAVYLPPGYQAPIAHFPVIYFLHGLPANPDSYQGFAWVEQAATQGKYGAIIVAPQGARTVNADREYLNWGPRENWHGAIANDLTKCIDSRFRTIPTREGRALIGLSAGGYGAFEIGLRHLETFATVQSWGGYFYATDPSGLHRLDLGSPGANSNATVPRGRWLRAEMKQWPSFVGFYVGRQDSRFMNANVQFDKGLSQSRIPHLFRVYGGAHSGALWRQWATVWIGLALRHMALPRAG